MAACVANGLAAHFGSIVVLEEEPEPKWHILRSRARRLGWMTALGQAACAALLKVAARRMQARIDAVVAEHGLATSLPPAVHRRFVGSVNSKACRDALRALQPRVVAVYGTRVIRRETLGAVSAPFINYHAGINPKYRGQHPGYWARVNGDAQNAGVTVHLVDEGVDTGAVLYQSRVAFRPDDSIMTYQWVQMAHALPLLARAIEDALAGNLRPQRVRLPSRQWFPPTLWAYAWNGLTRGVW